MACRRSDWSSPNQLEWQLNIKAGLAPKRSKLKMLRSRLLLFASIPCVVTQANHREPYGTAYNVGSEILVRFRDSELRDPSFCEPYEEMYIDEDDCNVFCMVNSKLGSLVFRDRVRRRLQTCLPSTMPCGLCRRRVFVTGLPQNMNVSAPGKCLDDCRCAAHSIGAAALNEIALQCQALRNVKFQPYRKQVQSPQVDGFEISLPSPERRDRSRCEPYETSSYTLAVGSQEVYDLQCRTVCVVSGTIGLLHIRSPPRPLGPSHGNQCRQPTASALHNAIEVLGSQEQLVGFCNRGTCSQLTRNNLRPRTMTSNDRFMTGAFHRDVRGPLNVTEFNDAAPLSHGIIQ